MVQSIAISEKTTRKYLRDHCHLQRTSESVFFPEWQSERPPLNNTDLERLT